MTILNQEKAVKQIRAFLSIPMNYQIDWNESKEQRPRVEKATFLEPGCEADDKNLAGMSFYQYPWWNKSVEVVDYEGGHLPDVIYVTVFCSGYYQGEFGGSSWHVHKAFLAKENAEKHDKDSQWERWWALEAHRRR